MDGQSWNMLSPVAADIMSALIPLGFDFAQHEVATGCVRGYTTDAVIEIRSDDETVSFLFSNSEDIRQLVRSAVYMATLSSVVGIDFPPWLARQLSGRCSAAPWRRSRKFGETRVTVQSLCGDAVILTLELSTDQLH
jgi:hypothetical protein